MSHDPVVMAVSRTLARIMAERDPSRTWIASPRLDEEPKQPVGDDDEQTQGKAA